MVQDLYVLMITAAVVSILFKLLKQPVVLGYIVAGVLVGPYLFGKSLVNPDNVKQWGDIGVLFVLFCIGLEFRLKNLISSGKVAAIGALTIILGMMLLGYVVGVDAKFDMVNSLFLAGMLCMSSTTIVMKAIDEAGRAFRQGSYQHPHRGGCGSCGTDGIALQYSHPSSVRWRRVGKQGSRSGYYTRGMVRLWHSDYPDADTRNKEAFE